MWADLSRFSKEEAGHLNHVLTVRPFFWGLQDFVTHCIFLQLMK
jgi:hypothetical protein